jgi:Flp pilus assembly protein CpaB
MKKIIPIIGAVLIFLVVSALLRPAPATTVVVVAYDLQAGTVLAEQDLVIQAMPASIVPGDALTGIAEAVGQPLRVDRGQGDILRASQLGAPAAQLEPNERAIALRVTDASGVGGTLLPGQRVGVVAVINQTGRSSTDYSFSVSPIGETEPVQGDTDPRYSQSGLYSKAAVEGLRILYVDSAWSAVQTQRLPVDEPQQENALPVGGVATNERAEDGSVILAAPVDLQTIIYDFRADGGIRQSRTVNAIELLAALASMDGVKFSLYLMPPGEEVQTFTSPGLWMPDLVLFPQPTSTPTPRPGGMQP